MTGRTTATGVSIRYMIALFTGAVLAVSVALLLVLTLASVLRQWRADSLVRARNTANLVALSSQQALESGDVIALDRLMREVKRDPQLERVIVSDPLGNPISDSAPEERMPALLRQTPALWESARIVGYGTHSDVLVPISRLGTPLGAVYVRFSLREQQATERRMLQRGITIGAIALAVSAALAIAFATILSAPLQRLAHSMDRVAGGQLSERVPAGNWRELRQMAASFNRMAAALAQRIHAERDARAEAEEANQAKDQFVALVSHELRNPLNAITSGIHLLRASCPAEGSTARTLEIVERNAALQARLVNDLLDLSRLHRGKLQLQRTPVEVEKAVVAACQSHEAQAKEAGLTLTCHCEPGLWVHGDPDRLQQVVLNLLSNALKFTPAGGAVSVTTIRHDTQGRVTVADTGIGLDRMMLDHLFEMFHQGEVAGTRKPGLGIGLALVKGIVERHGGRVWAESEGAGKGSRFIVELPLSEAPHMAVAESTAAGRGERPIRVLLIEDNADARTMVADSLTLEGMEVHTAGSGEEGLEVLQGARPDVMLVDIGLPGMDGFEFLRRAREQSGAADVPAFAVTGWGEEEHVRQGRQAGFAGHFVKPVNMEALAEHVREWVGRVSKGSVAHRGAGD